MEEKQDGYGDLKKLVDFMKLEGVLKLQTANCSIEVHPAYLGRSDYQDMPEKTEQENIVTPEERLEKAKRAMSEMLGGL